MITVRQVLAGHQHDVWQISPSATVYAAIEEMTRRNVGALAVVQDGRLVGILSERDYTGKVALKERSSRSTRVEEIMTSRVVTVGPEHSIEDCMKLMNRGSFRHLPVLQDDRLVGMVSVKDLLRAMLSEQDFIIHQLENYIAGAA